METTTEPNSGPRCMIDATGFSLYNSDGLVVYRIPAMPPEPDQYAEPQPRYSPLTRLVRKLTAWAWADEIDLI